MHGLYPIARVAGLTGLVQILDEIACPLRIAGLGCQTEFPSVVSHFHGDLAEPRWIGIDS